MSAYRIPGPTNRGNPPLAIRGLLARLTAAHPGPVDRTQEAAAPSASAATRGTDWVPASVSSFAARPRPRPGVATMVRIAHRDEPTGGSIRLEFETLAAAQQALEVLLEHRTLAAPFGRTGGSTAARVEWLATRVHAGEYTVLWRPTQLLTVPEKEEAPPPRPAPAPVWVAPPPPKAPDYSTFPPELDAAAMASVLMQAAADGVPFCEECQKAAAQQQGAA